MEATDEDRERVRSVIEDGLEASELDADEVEPGTWMTVLSGQWKRTIPVMLRIDDRSLHVRSLLCPDPDEAHEAVYRYLLQRNQRPSPVHFAVDDEGDVIMTGVLPLSTVDTTSFDRLLGTILTTADEVFNAVLRRGFAGYIEHEQRWRAANELPPNPIDDPDA